jgi:hypothetical protein
MNVIDEKCEGWCIMCSIPKNIVNGPPFPGRSLPCCLNER